MYESVEEGRSSIQAAFNKGDFYRGFDIINDSIRVVKENIQSIREYSFRVGSKSDNKAKSSMIDNQILSTGKELNAIRDYIQEIKDYKYINRNERTENIRRLKEKEKAYYDAKTEFEDLANKIKNQNLNLIDSARNSIRMSQGSNTQKDGQQLMTNEREYLQGIEDKEKQVNIIMQVTNQINEISKQAAELVAQSGEKINSIEDNVKSTNLNIAGAVEHMKDAKKANESSGGYTNIILYVVVGVVAVLILMTLIMPS